MIGITHLQFSNVSINIEVSYRKVLSPAESNCFIMIDGEFLKFLIQLSQI